MAYGGVESVTVVSTRAERYRMNTQNQGLFVSSTKLCEWPAELRFYHTSLSPIRSGACVSGIFWSVESRFPAQFQNFLCIFFPEEMCRKTLPLEVGLGPTIRGAAYLVRALSFRD
jgi:hypothetical protein